MIIPIMENVPPAPSLILRSRKFGFRVIEHNDSLRLVPLRWSAFTWILLIVMLYFLFLVYKGLHIHVLWMKLVVVGPCLLLAAAFMFGILTRFGDGVVITADRITYRYGLIRRSLPIAQLVDIQVRTDIQRYRNDGDEKVNVKVELLAVTSSRSFHLFDLHGGEADIVRMEQLGEQIRTIMLRYVR